MGKGLFIGNKDGYLERFEQESGELRLLASAEGAEIMLQNIRSGEVCFIEPSENRSTMEFFYILKGEIEFAEGSDTCKLAVGDYFYVRRIKHPVQFQTLTDVTLLYSSTSPQFNFISKSINELLELADQVKEKDPYTQLHNERVKKYAIRLADKLELSNSRKRNVLFASLFHDVGKIGLPDEILTKAGALTEEEWALIKKHPELGAMMITETRFAEIASIILQHHERVDGSGYPQGLRDDEIMLEAKIVAVADVFDAMTSDRVYRKAIPTCKVIEVIVSMKGILYDEAVVDALVAVLEEEGKLDDCK